jgi:hypothetical protein
MGVATFETSSLLKQDVRKPSPWSYVDSMEVEIAIGIRYI